MSIKRIFLPFIAAFIVITPTFGGNIISCDSFETCPDGVTSSAIIVELEAKVAELEAAINFRTFTLVDDVQLGQQQAFDSSDVLEGFAHLDMQLGDYLGIDVFGNGHWKFCSDDPLVLDAISSYQQPVGTESEGGILPAENTLFCDVGGCSSFDVILDVMPGRSWYMCEAENPSTSLEIHTATPTDPRNYIAAERSPQTHLLTVTFSAGATRFSACGF